MKKSGYVAFDLGAESGRAMLATLSKDKLELQEAHRFLNLPQRLPSGWHWDLTGLWGNIVTGLKQAGQLAERSGVKLESVGVDTWGVDYGLVGKSGQLLGLPYCYRDARNAPAMRRTRKTLGDEKLYEATGIQPMPFNTVFQLVAQRDSESAVIDHAKRLLFMPDLLHFFLSGEAVNEATIASTSELIDPRTGKWHKSLVRSLKLPTTMLGKIVPAGTPIGTLLPEVAKDAGLERLRVIAPGSHDTASAVAAVPVDDATVARGDWAYLSSGTWSLMGAEIDKPLLSNAARKAAFTNERGVGGKIRLLKNIAGLWLVQECRRDLAKLGQELDYATLTRMAEEAQPLRTLVDPDHAPFMSPGDMLAKISAFAKATNQPVPQTPGQYVRCCLESLSMAYRRVLTLLEEVLDRRISVLHIVGGGGRNELLNRMTADAVGRRVIVGPYEATAVGNALTQAIGAGQVRDLAHLRAIVRKSFDPVVVEPHVNPEIEQTYRRYLALLGK